MRIQSTITGLTLEQWEMVTRATNQPFTFTENEARVCVTFTADFICEARHIEMPIGPYGGLIVSLQMRALAAALKQFTEAIGPKIFQPEGWCRPGPGHPEYVDVYAEPELSAGGGADVRDEDRSNITGGETDAYPPRGLPLVSQATIDEATAMQERDREAGGPPWKVADHPDHDLPGGWHRGQL